MPHIKVFVLLCLLWLCPFLITSFFNQPAIDDYWNASAINDYGRWGAVTYFYHTFSIRYVSLFVMSFCNTLPQHKVWIFKVWPLITILLLFLAVYFLYASLFDKRESKHKLIAFTLLCIVLQIASMRSVFEGLYWMSSAVCYQLSLAVFAVATGAILRNIKSPRPILKITAVTASCLLPGTVEIIVPVYILVLLCLLFLSFKRKFDKTLILCCLVISVVISLFLFTSGINLLRVIHNKSFYDPTWQTALYLSFQSCAYYLIIWLFNPMILSAVVLVLVSELTLSKQFAITFTFYRSILLLAFILFIGFAIYFPLHFFESSLPYPRITMLFFFFFFLTWMLIGTSKFLPDSFFEKQVNQRRYIKPLAAGLFFLFAFTNKNFLLVSRDLLTGSAARYNLESFSRYQVIRNCTSDTCYIPLYTAWPYFVQYAKKESTDNTALQHMNEYFKKTVLLRKKQ